MKFLIQLTIGILILVVLFIFIFILLQPSADYYENKNYSHSTYDIKGELVIVEYNVQQLIVDAYIVSEINWIIEKVFEEAACKEDMGHDLNIAINLRFKQYVPMVIEVNCDVSHSSH